MGWRKSHLAGLTIAAISLTGCTPLPLLKTSSGELPNGTPVRNPDRRSISESENTESSKFAGPVTDNESADSTEKNDDPGISLARERPQQMPLPKGIRPKPLKPVAKEPTVRQVNEEVSGPIFPPENEGVSPPVRPLVPNSGVPEAKKSSELPRIINGTPPVMAQRSNFNEKLNDPNYRTTPTVSGVMLNLGPNESAVERAIELAKLLDVAESENRNFLTKVKTLELALENREKMLRDDETEITKASQDLVQARAELQKLREEFSKLKTKLRQVEKEDLDTLKSIILALEKLLDSAPPGT